MKSIFPLTELDFPPGDRRRAFAARFACMEGRVDLKLEFQDLAIIARLHHSLSI
jgi:hypothetical protein